MGSSCRGTLSILAAALTTYHYAFLYSFSSTLFLVSSHIFFFFRRAAPLKKYYFLSSFIFFVSRFLLWCFIQDLLEINWTAFLTTHFRTFYHSYTFAVYHLNNWANNCISNKWQLVFLKLELFERSRVNFAHWQLLASPDILRLLPLGRNALLHTFSGLLYFQCTERIYLPI